MAKDWHLLQRIASKDAEALSELYDAYAGVVFSLALRILRDPKSAETVVQKTFFSVWQNADRYEPQKAAVRTWLITIARNSALDIRRKNHRWREVSLSEEEKMIDSGGREDPLRSVIDDERRSILLAALSEIPEDQRRAIYLAYYDGLSHRQIAELLKQPLGTVKTRIQLGLDKLRRRLVPVFRNE